MSWKPVAHRIIVKPDEVEKKTKSGIVLARDERQEKNAQVHGTILSIGEDAWVAFNPKTEFAGLKVGDRVAYARYAGKPLEDGTLALVDEDVVAVEVQDDMDAQTT